MKFNTLFLVVAILAVTIIGGCHVDREELLQKVDTEKPLVERFGGESHTFATLTTVKPMTGVKGVGYVMFEVGGGKICSALVIPMHEIPVGTKVAVTVVTMPRGMVSSPYFYMVQ